MVTLKINNKTDFDFSQSGLKTTAEKTLKKVKLNQDYTISLALVSEKEIKSINSKRRGEEKSAGVISFAEKDLKSDFYVPESKSIYLGEIFLCPDYIKKEGKQHDKGFEQELRRFFKHGVLHLAGLSHDEMEEIQVE